ncbi:phage tail protein [Acinetobacter sp. HY1485]|uniref:phage tail protein n=1 Tax=Acinetobacter sp. HY1485 TaxID=2970918 RepID=UPI0022B96A9D|nr:phage tail protein [Acinetobacter sp. HY1485]
MGSSKKQTIGYKFFAGIHMVLSHGPIDAIKKILVDDSKVLLEGNYVAGSYTISKESLFGGESSQGGIAGTLDILDGSPDQLQNSYLTKLAKNAESSQAYLPAYRGVASMVLHDKYSYEYLAIDKQTGQYTTKTISGDRGMLLGMNPYLKTWKTLVQRIHKTSDGDVQWYDEKAAIGTVTINNLGQIAFILDDSGSMSDANMKNMKAGVNNVLDSISGNNIDVMIQAINSGVRIYRKASSSDIDSAKAFVNSLTANGWTSATNAYGNINNFFTFSDSSTLSEKIVLTLSDGEMQDVETAKANIQTAFKKVKFVGLGMGTVGSLNDFDNTGNPVQVVSADQIAAAISGVFYTYADMNPAHIIRECLVNDVWGMGKPESEINDESFKTAADTLYAEQLGMSITWTQESAIESFLEQIRNHINAVIYEDPSTGLTVLKLIRDDYDEASLVILNESDISEVTEFQRATFSELINQVTVTYTNVATGEDGTITVQDTALVSMQNSINSKSVEYKGFSNINNAGRVAMRDLKVLATPLISAEIKVKRSVARNFRQGDVFKWDWKDYNVNSVVMRVLAVDLGNGKNNSVTVTCTQDIFAMPDSTVTAVQPSNPESIDLTPVTQQIAFDMPYLELVQRQGQSAIDAILANNPEASFFGVACARPTTGAVAQNVQLYLMSEASGNYLRDSNFDFCSVFTLATDLDYLDTQIVTASTADFSLIDVTEDLPVWAQIGDEIVSITAISVDDSNNIVLTVKRGVLDTVPAQHSKDSVGYVWDVMNGGSETEHVETETISAKLVTSSLSALLDVGDATAISATMQGRAYRPYPPANVQIDGKYYPDTVGDKINLTWSHRNRLQQTGGDYLGWVDGNVTLEPGVTYYLTITDEKSNVLLDQNIGAVDQYSFDVSASSANQFHITLKSVRNSIESYQIFTHSVKASFEAPYNVVATYSE